jgi:hypothetical protein
MKALDAVAPPKAPGRRIPQRVSQGMTDIRLQGRRMRFEILHHIHGKYGIASPREKSSRGSFDIASNHADHIVTFRQDTDRTDLPTRLSLYSQENTRGLLSFFWVSTRQERTVRHQMGGVDPEGLTDILERTFRIINRPSGCCTQQEMVWRYRRANPTVAIRKRKGLGVASSGETRGCGPEEEFRMPFGTQRQCSEYVYHECDRRCCSLSRCSESQKGSRLKAVLKSNEYSATRLGHIAATASQSSIPVQVRTNARQDFRTAKLTLLQSISS